MSSAYREDKNMTVSKAQEEAVQVMLEVALARAMRVGEEDQEENQVPDLESREYREARRREAAELWALLDIPTRALLIQAAKQNRRGRLPQWAVALGIDLEDKQEVGMYKSIDRKMRFPFLTNEPEATKLTDQRVQLKKRFLYGMLVYNISTAEGITVGQVSLSRRTIWVELIDVSERLWKEIPL
jgi:hypothetical protein